MKTTDIGVLGGEAGLGLGKWRGDVEMVSHDSPNVGDGVVLVSVM